jgi:Clustered mitochondria/Translation initiation factor eIF3 subunit 135
MSSYMDASDGSLSAEEPPQSDGQTGDSEPAIDSSSLRAAQERFPEFRRRRAGSQSTNLGDGWASPGDYVAPPGENEPSSSQSGGYAYTTDSLAEESDENTDVSPFERTALEKPTPDDAPKPIVMDQSAYLGEGSDTDSEGNDAGESFPSAPHASLRTSSARSAYIAVGTRYGSAAGSTFASDDEEEEYYAGTGTPSTTAEHAEDRYERDREAEMIDGDESLLDFNTRYQQVVEQIANQITTGTPLSVKVSLHARLTAVARDFMYCSKSVARVILNELHLPLEKKTLKPVNVGGVAGGDKYIANGILFKVATADGELFETDEAAAKVAGHELMGLTCFETAVRTGSGRQDGSGKTRHLSIPLACLIDLRGYRCLAECLLPIGGDSLVTGTADAGRTVLGLENAPGPFGDLMRDVAEHLNVLVHRVAPQGGGMPVEVAGPADVELHQGKDGRVYVLDVSRTMPPCGKVLPKIVTARASHLYELLRPELVNLATAPLSSDAMSAFPLASDRMAQNLAVEAATEKLFEINAARAAAAWKQHVATEWNAFVVGNPVAQLLTTRPPAREISSDRDFYHHARHFLERLCKDLSRVLHENGVNVRFAGLVFALLTSEGEDSLETEFSRSVILVEMIARVAKLIHRRSMRFTQRAFANSVVAAPLLRCSERLLNLLLSHSSRSGGDFWSSIVAVELNEKFMWFTHSELWKDLGRPRSGTVLSDATLVDGLPGFRDGGLREATTSLFWPMLHTERAGLSKNSGISTLVLAARFCQMSGVKMDSHVHDDMVHRSESFFDHPRPFQLSSVKRLSPVVKSMNVVEHAMGYVSKVRGLHLMKKKHTEDARRFYLDAYRQFDLALHTDAADQGTLRNQAQTLEGLVKCILVEQDDPKLPLGPDSQLWPVAKHVEMLFEQAVQVNPKDSKTLQQLAMFGEALMPYPLKSAHHALEALKQTPTNASALACLGRCVAKLSAQDRTPELDAVFAGYEKYRAVQHHE